MLIHKTQAQVESMAQGKTMALNKLQNECLQFTGENLANSLLNSEFCIEELQGLEGLVDSKDKADAVAKIIGTCNCSGVDSIEDLSGEMVELITLNAEFILESFKAIMKKHSYTVEYDADFDAELEGMSAIEYNALFGLKYVSLKLNTLH